MEVTIFDDLFNPNGLKGSAMSAWLDYYLIYEAHTQHINLGRLRQRALMDVLMKFSPNFRRELNEYRKRQEIKRKMVSTLADICKIFNQIMEDEDAIS